jgi:hypothetical protein
LSSPLQGKKYELTTTEALEMRSLNTFLLPSLLTILLEFSHSNAALTKTTFDVSGKAESKAQCQKISFPSDKNRCVDIVEKSFYLNLSAVKSCISLAFSTDALPCLQSIANHEYLPTEIDSCSSYKESFDTIKCFSESGRVLVTEQPQCPTVGDTKKIGSEVVHQMRNQSYTMAMDGQIKLLLALDACKD